MTELFHLFNGLRWHLGTVQADHAEGLCQHIQADLWLLSMMNLLFSINKFREQWFSIANRALFSIAKRARASVASECRFHLFCFIMFVIELVSDVI